MIHIYCDLCQRKIEDSETRYIVRLETFPADDHSDPELELEEDRDHLLEIHQALETQQPVEGQDLDEQVFIEMQFDLCPECRRRFMRNPLGRDLVQLQFSQN